MGHWTVALYVRMAGCDKSFQCLFFVLTQLHFCQWSSFSCYLPSLIVQRPARIVHFSLLCMIVKLVYTSMLWQYSIWPVPFMLEGLRSQCHVVVTAIGVNYFRASNPHFAAVKCHCLCWVAHCPWSLVPFWHCVFATHLYSPLFWPICLPCSAWKENKFWLGKYRRVLADFHVRVQWTNLARLGLQFLSTVWDKFRQAIDPGIYFISSATFNWKQKIYLKYMNSNSTWQRKYK